MARSGEKERSSRSFAEGKKQKKEGILAVKKL